MSAPYRIDFPIVWSRNYYSAADTWPMLYPTDDFIDSMREWCKEVVGPNMWNYYGFGRKIPFEFRFKKEEDLLAFKLRFGV